MIERSAGARADQGSRPTLLVSACLLGVHCNHLGEANTHDAVVALRATHRVVPVCPETAGGLPTPRHRAERQPDGTVRDEDGSDVTEWFTRGAAHAVELAAATGARRAVLKARSPSCGCEEIFDGTFTGTRVRGEGVTAEALRRAGVEVVSEEDLDGG
ncbi:MAG TPA: DUF523 domain-containing protein [Acidimicrobiales bacterium]|nr:DUF523 domain-containing protein [Acidimicrobiales bacterium]